MLVENKVAVIYGGSGAIGSAAARVLAREGAKVFIGGRSKARLEEIAAQIGSGVETFTVDALDTQATIDATAALAERSGGIDIVVNAVSFMHDQGTELPGLTLEAFMQPLTTFLPALFNSARAATPHMGKRGAAAFIHVLAPAGRMTMPGHLGHIATCAAEETFVRNLAVEVAPRNIRALSLRSHAIPEALAEGSYTRELFGPRARAMGIEVEQWLEGAAQGTMLKRLPTLSQVAETIAFLASDRAGAMTATSVNMTAGAVPD